MQVLETPVPELKPGMLLVRNLYSLISAGTEGNKVTTARKGYIGKAKEKPQQVKQVVDTLRTQGAVQTYRAVMKKLDAHSPLGYSCVGEVIGIRSQKSEGRWQKTEDAPVERSGRESGSTGQGGRESEGRCQTSEFKIGDFVACGGATACHAEVVAIPKQLAVRVAQSSKLKVICRWRHITHWGLLHYKVFGRRI